MAENELRNPFVVQCSGCRKVVSDSFTLQNMKHGFLIHTYCTLIPDENTCSGEGIFDKCLYKKVNCGCGVAVGLYFVSVSGEWNGYADTFALSKEKIVSYALGSTVAKEKGMAELTEDVENLKNVVAKMYKKLFQ